MTTTTELHDPAQVARTMRTLRGQCWNLAGPSNAGNRQALMLAITGEKRPRAVCGVTALERELFARLNPEGSCAYRRWEWVKDWAIRTTEPIEDNTDNTPDRIEVWYNHETTNPRFPWTVTRYEQGNNPDHLAWCETFDGAIESARRHARIHNVRAYHIGVNENRYPID